MVGAGKSDREIVWSNVGAAIGAVQKVIIHTYDTFAILGNKQHQKLTRRN
jgi:hypothetical protein